MPSTCTSTNLLVLLSASALVGRGCRAFSAPAAFSSRTNSPWPRSSTTSLRAVETPPAGVSTADDAESTSTSGASSSVSATKRVGINSRGAKMNEIDFTLAPTDVSLSRCYQMSKSNGSSAPSTETAQTSQSLSLTRALNTASNRAVRRILLSRSWPSAEALNLSLRTVLMQQQQQKEEEEAQQVQGEQGEKERKCPVPYDRVKCPVPRPILNILMNKRGEAEASGGPDPSSLSSEERERMWIDNQIADFRESYGSVPDYDRAEAYLESILSLATGGTESERVSEVMGGVYEEPYARILSVIQSVGAVLEPADNEGKRLGIARKLVDQDICLSMLDKIAMANERKVKASSGSEEGGEKKEQSPLAVPYDAAARLAYESDESNQSVAFEEFKDKYVAETVAMVTAKKKQRDEGEKVTIEAAKVEETEEEPKGAYEKGRKRRLVRSLLSGNKKSDAVGAGSGDVPAGPTEGGDAPADVGPPDEAEIEPYDLGGVLLSAEEPTMTRQLNVLSNIVQRTLIFGGDQELLVLAETLDADKPAFVQRWYADDPLVYADAEAETRPGVQYLNALIRLLRDCYAKGVLKDVTPTLPLTTGYLNAYGRLTASLIELGSGYVRPSSGSATPLALSTAAATGKYWTSTAPPKTPREELGRFARWESAVRKNRENPYPDDLVGTWNVQDVVGTQTIGTTEVTFKPQGELGVEPPMQGLRWRLDPGPTHLDTCTFQVLSDDGAILQYKGFVDRGSRLEARVSKRSVSMRGGVSFLMRDVSVGSDYFDDMVPMNYKSGQTKFVMSRNVSNGEDGSSGTSYSSSSNPGLESGLRCPPVAEGEREILNGPDGPILVTRVAGSYYAVDATCPHLNLPMKKGKISVDEETKRPTLTCSFHNSCFELESGRCTKWVTGALGTQNELVAGIMSNVGSEKKDIVAYRVTEGEDGSLVVTSEAPKQSTVAA